MRGLGVQRRRRRVDIHNLRRIHGQTRQAGSHRLHAQYVLPGPQRDRPGTWGRARTPGALAGHQPRRHLRNHLSGQRRTGGRHRPARHKRERRNFAGPTAPTTPTRPHSCSTRQASPQATTGLRGIDLEMLVSASTGACNRKAHRPHGRSRRYRRQAHPHGELDLAVDHLRADAGYPELHGVGYALAYRSHCSAVVVLSKITEL